MHALTAFFFLIFQLLNSINIKCRPCLSLSYTSLLPQEPYPFYSHSLTHSFTRPILFQHSSLFQELRFGLTFFKNKPIYCINCRGDYDDTSWPVGYHIVTYVTESSSPSTQQAFSNSNSQYCQFIFYYPKAYVDITVRCFCPPGNVLQNNAASATISPLRA